MFESKEDEEARKHEQTNAEYVASKVDSVKDYTQDKLHAASDGIKGASTATVDYVKAIPGETRKGATKVQRKIGKFESGFHSQ